MKGQKIQLMRWSTPFNGLVFSQRSKNTTEVTLEPTADQWKSISFSMPGSHGFRVNPLVARCFTPLTRRVPTPPPHLFRYSPDDLAEPRPGVIFVGGPNPFNRVESLGKLVLEFSTSTEFLGLACVLLMLRHVAKWKISSQRSHWSHWFHASQIWSINHKIPRWTPQMAPWGLTILWLWNFGYQQRSFKKVWVAKHVKQRAHLNYRLCVHSLKQHSEIPYLQANTTDFNLLAQTALAFFKVPDDSDPHRPHYPDSSADLMTTNRDENSLSGGNGKKSIGR